MNSAQWWALVLTLAASVGGVVALGGLIAPYVRSSVVQRTLWRTALLVSLAVVLCEMTGLQRLFDRLSLAPAHTRTPARFAVQTHVFLSDNRSSRLAENAESSVNNSTGSSNLAQRLLWWPGAVWLLGSILLFARQGIARGLLLRHRLRWSFCSDSTLLEQVRSLSKQLGLRRRVTVMECSELSGPIACGIVSPVICLPSRFSQDFTSAQQQGMLAHELAHLAARDPEWYGLSDLLIALLWWHPLSWWLQRQLHRASEHAADDASLLVEGGPGALAESLVVVGRRLTHPKSLGWIGVEGTGFQSSMGRRVTRLLSLRSDGWKPTSRRVAVMSFAIGMFMFVGVITASNAWIATTDSSSQDGAEFWGNSVLGRAWKAVAGSGDATLLAQAPSSDKVERTAAAEPALHTRTFKFDAQTLSRGLSNAMNQIPVGEIPVQNSETKTAARFRSFLAASGVDIKRPRAMFLNDRTEVLMVRATLSELDIVEHALQILLTPPPQIVVETKFVELEDGDTGVAEIDRVLKGGRDIPAKTQRRPQPFLPSDSIRGSRLQPGSNLPAAAVTGILKPSEFRRVLKILEQRRGATVLSSPNVITLSGRQAQVKVVEVRNVVTDLEVSTEGQVQPVSEQFELGPVIDIVPHVVADGVTVEMSIIPSLTEFLGYDNDSKIVAGSGKATQTVPQPRFRVRQITAIATALDGQTVVLGVGSVEATEETKSGSKVTQRKVRKNLLVFVTPTLVDDAGNRVHSEAEMDSVEPKAGARK